MDSFSKRNRTFKYMRVRGTRARRVASEDGLISKLEPQAMGSSGSSAPAKSKKSPKEKEGVTQPLGPKIQRWLDTFKPPKNHSELERANLALNRLVAAMCAFVPWERWHTPILKKGEVVDYSEKFEQIHAFESEIAQWGVPQDTLDWLAENKVYRIDHMTNTRYISWNSLSRAVMVAYRRVDKSFPLF